MVSENTFSKLEVNRRIIRIEQQLEALTKLVNHHLGYQPGANTPNVPHPTMSAISRGNYTVTNGTTDRTYDADTVLVAELADIVYTLITDLQSVKVLGGG